MTRVLLAGSGVAALLVSRTGQVWPHEPSTGSRPAIVAAGRHDVSAPLRTARVKAEVDGLDQST